MRNNQARLNLYRVVNLFCLVLGVVILSLVLSKPQDITPVKAATTYGLRQEINIIDGIVTAAGDDGSLVLLDPTQYSGTKTYYFESVAKVDSGTLTLTLQRAATTTVDATISVTATSFTRQRVSFTPPAGATGYNINLSGGTNPQVKAARLIVIQSSEGLASTETQIEIGDREPTRTNTVSQPLYYPKYWYYDSANWDGTISFFAEVTSSTSSTNTRTVTLQEDDGSFGNWTNKVTIQSAASSTTPVRTRSAAFTPISGRNYRIASLNSNTAQSHNIFNAKIIVRQSGTITKLEPQYLVANNIVGAGTALQNFDAYFDPADWVGVTNTYYHEANSFPGFPYFGGATSSPGASSTSCVNPRPTGLLLGDVMIAQIASRNTATAITDPGGWTPIQQTTQTTLLRSATFYKIATLADMTTASYTFTVGSEANRCTIVAIRGQDPSSVINTSSVQANAAPASPFTEIAASITTTRDNSLVWLGFSSADDNTHGNWAFTPFQVFSVVEVSDVLTTLGSDTSLAIALGIFDSTGSTQTGNANQNTNGGDANIGFLIAVNRDNYSDLKLQSNPNGTPADVPLSAVNTVVNRERSGAMTMPGSASEIDAIVVTNRTNVYSSRIIVATVLDPLLVDITGNAYQNATGTTAWTGCDDSSARISLVINGGTAATTSCNATTGAYSFTNISVDPLLLLTVFFNTNNGNTDKGVAFTASTAGDTTGLNIRRNRIEAYYDFTNETIGPCSSSGPAQCANVPFSVVSGDLVGETGVTFHVNSGVTYYAEVGDDTTVHQLHLNGTYEGWENTLTLTGSGQSAAAPLYMDTGGVFNAPDYTIFTGSATVDTTVPAQTYYVLIINGTDTFYGGGFMNVRVEMQVLQGSYYQIGNNMDIGSDTIENSGSLKVSSGAEFVMEGDTLLVIESQVGSENCFGGLDTVVSGNCSGSVGGIGYFEFTSVDFGDGGAGTGFTTTFFGTAQEYIFLSDFTIQDGVTVAGGSSIIYVGDEWTPILDGIFTANTSTVVPGGFWDGVSEITSNGSPFYNFEVNDFDQATTVRLIDPLDVNNDFTITSGTFDVNSTNQPVTIGGDFVNNDILNSRNGTFTFDTAGSTVLNSGCTTVATCTNQDFYNLVINKGSSSDVVTLQTNHLKVLNTLTITQGSVSQGNQHVRAEGATAVSIGANGTWSNLGTGDTALGGSLTNAGTLTFKANNTCGGANDIVITAITGTPSWSGAGSFELRDVSIANQNAAVAINVFSGTDAGGNTGSWTFYTGCTAGSLTVDIVDSGGTPVASPSVSMVNKNVTILFQSSTGTLGTSSERIRATNTTSNPLWTLSIAATDGPTAFWDGATSDYDFNDGTANAGDGADSDSLGGQMTINPSVATLTPQGGCTNTGLSLGSSTAFNEQTPVNSVTLVSTSGSAELGCYWDLTDVAISQTIPAQQAIGTYSISLTVSIIAN